MPLLGYTEGEESQHVMKIQRDLGINLYNGENTEAKCLKNKQTKSCLKKKLKSLCQAKTDSVRSP